MNLISILSAVAVASGGAPASADKPDYVPAPAWVEPLAIPFATPSSGAALDSLLVTTQSRFSPDGTSTFVEQAVRINSADGLGQAGSLLAAWNPLTDTLNINRARIVRQGKSRDLLAGGSKFTVLRRETNLEAAMIDGQLTATLQPSDLQVGDVIDFAYTFNHREPALEGHAQNVLTLAHSGTIGRLAVRASWLIAHPMHWWKTDDLPIPTITTRDSETHLALDLLNTTTPTPPAGARLRDRMRGVMSFSDLDTWSAVSSLAYPLFARASTLQPGSPLRDQVARIRAISTNPKVRALAALQLAEAQVRYFYVGLDVGGYTPAAADLTWTRRFGDCKGKTALLLALLQGLGVSAEPVLVNTQTGDGLNQRLPQMAAFNHVLVRAHIGSKSYWLDATRSGDADLDNLQTPDFKWALPLRAVGAELEPLEPDNPILPQREKILTVDASRGADKPSRVHIEVTLRGDLGLAFNLGLKLASAADRDRALREYLTGDENWVTADKVAFTYDDKSSTLHATLDGVGAPPFNPATGGKDWQLDESALGWSADFKRDTTFHKDTPFSVAYPDFERTRIEITLPGMGRGFSLLNDSSIAETIGGVAYSRASKLSGDHITVVTSHRAVASEFPASEAPTAQTALRSLSVYEVVVRQTAEVATIAEGGSASDPRGQAAAAFQAGDFKIAVQRFTTAIEAGPNDAQLYYDRGAAHAALGETAQARLDFGEALRINPDDAFALFALGRIDLASGADASAAKRFTAAQAAAKQPHDMARAVAMAYSEIDRFADSIPYLDRALASEKDPAQRASTLNARCWARAVLGRQLEAALADCDEALRLLPSTAKILDSRGLVHLRLGGLAASIGDYDEALKLRGGQASSLFGRGLAKIRDGRITAGKSDLVRAEGLDHKIVQRFATWGLLP